MKFSHGAWLWESNVTATCMQRVHESEAQTGCLKIAALDRLGREGGDRFEGKVLEITVTSPTPDVIRVHIRQHTSPPGRVVPDIDYSLRANDVEISDNDDLLSFRSGNLLLTFKKSTWEMTFWDRHEKLTQAGQNSLGHMAVREANGTTTDHLMQRLDLGVAECIYGMGERFGPLVKNGQTVSIWNEDGGTSSDLAYKNIPFYLSNRGYGLLVNTPGKVEFEIATERVSKIQFSVEDQELDYYFFLGPDPKDVLDKYTRLTGRPAIPPAWSFGLWLSTSFTTQYNEATVNEFVDGMAARDLPLNVFHFDCFWMKERHWCNFLWDRDAFPDPEGMLKRLKAKGLRICLWINPYISKRSELFEEAHQNGYLLKRADGSTYQRDAWQPGMGLVDFTNPKATEWYCSKIQVLLDMGVDSFKTDFAELIPTDVVYHDHSDPKLMHNHYAYLYNKAVFGLLEQHHGKGNAAVFARSASIGSQKFPVHWGGDCDATFEAMAEDLRGGLSFCMSGPAFWSHDIGGFSGKADPAVYKRWIAFGLLSSHSRLHGSESYRVPWLFDEESVDVLRHFTRLKNRLFPYIFGAAHDANEFGHPVMRAMVLEFPNDPACLHLDRQYMLGSSLLVAPLFRSDHIAEYYVPAGKWTNLLTGELVIGGSWRRESFDFMHLPLLVREHSIIPFSQNDVKTGWEFDQPLMLGLYQITEGADVSIRVPTSAGTTSTRFRCRRQGNEITLESEGSAKAVSINFDPSDHSGRSVVDWTDSSRPMSIKVP